MSAGRLGPSWEVRAAGLGVSLLAKGSSQVRIGSSNLEETELIGSAISESQIFPGPSLKSSLSFHAYPHRKP